MRTPLYALLGRFQQFNFPIGSRLPLYWTLCHFCVFVNVAFPQERTHCTFLDTTAHSRVGHSCTFGGCTCLQPPELTGKRHVPECILCPAYYELGLGCMPSAGASLPCQARFMCIGMERTVLFDRWHQTLVPEASSVGKRSMRETLWPL